MTKPTVSPASLPEPTRLRRAVRHIKKSLRRFLPDDVFLRGQFKRKFGFYPDLDSPQLFAEKILWLKLHAYTPLHTQCADKICVRDYVAATIGADFLIPAYLVTYDLRQVRPENIAAEQFVVKTNHDYGGVIICKDREQFDWKGARRKLRRHLVRNHYWRSRERAYREIRPGIIVERLLQGPGGGDIDDLKIFCFHGRAELVQVVTGRFEEQTITLYDRDWQMLPAGRTGIPTAATPHPRPPELDEMLRIAERLAEPFLFARIDLYMAEGRIWFGEITFYPAGGLLLFDPIDYEYAFGSLLRLPTSA